MTIQNTGRQFKIQDDNSTKTALDVFAKLLIADGALDSLAVLAQEGEEVLQDDAFVGGVPGDG